VPRRSHTSDGRPGYVGILSFELFFAESHSLKEKRMHLRSVKQQLQNRIGCSIAEVDHHETWQRSRLTLACATRHAKEMEKLLDEAERWLSGQAVELGRHQRLIVSPDDPYTAVPAPDGAAWEGDVEAMRGDPI
jgi:uncharacterized protein YlxP (DUF503 family)